MSSAKTNPLLPSCCGPNRLTAILGKTFAWRNAILRRSIENGNIPSMILWGPPGVGKTTLAISFPER